MTALTKDELVAPVGTVKVPSVQGQFANELPGVVDVVGYLAQEDIEPDEAHLTGVQRTLLLHSYPKFAVKVRLSGARSLTRTTSVLAGSSRTCRRCAPS